MKIGRKFLVALTAASMSTSAVAAPAAFAPTGDVAREGATLERANGIDGGWLIPAIAVVALILAIVLIAGGDSDSPASP
jgi:hypothetical protein